FGRTPTKQPRTVPLTEPVISALASLPHREGEVFRRPDGKPYARKEVAGGEIKTAFRAACRRAGIDGLTPRDLRDAWALRQLAAGCTLERSQELGGWSDDSRMVARFKRAMNARPRRLPMSARDTRRCAHVRL